MTNETRRDKRIRRSLRGVLGGFAVTVALLLVSEAAFRFYDHSREVRFVSQLDDWEIEDENIGWKPRPGFTHQQVSINSLGFRGEDIDLVAPEKTFRLAVLGDSTSFGLLSDSPYAEQLQNRLNNLECDANFQVINGAVEGYSSEEALARLQYDIMPLQPKLLVVYIGWNDLYRVDPLIPEAVTRKGSTLDQLAEHSMLVKHTFKFTYEYVMPRLRQTSEEDFVTYRNFQPIRYIDNLTAIIEEAEQNDMTVVLTTLPSILSDDMLDKTYLEVVHYPNFTHDVDLLAILWERYNETIRNIAQEHDVLLVDLAAEFEALDDEGTLFFDTVHFYNGGHEHITTSLFDALLNNDLLPCDEENLGRG